MDRIERERITFDRMARIYCQAHHRSGRREGEPCPDCSGLMAYANARLDHCCFGRDKPVCADCPVHCYEPERREQTRRMMRWSGPRMILRHPVLALFHLADRAVAGRRERTP